VLHLFYLRFVYLSEVSVEERKNKLKQDLLGQVSRLRKREEQIPPLEWVGPEVR
jgi:hypothetical protein